MAGTREIFEVTLLLKSLFEMFEDFINPLVEMIALKRALYNRWNGWCAFQDTNMIPAYMTTTFVPDLADILKLTGCKKHSMQFWFDRWQAMEYT